MKRFRNNRRGFTLAEVLIVVAILIVLAGVSVVGVVRYQRSLKQLELDGIAKEIFVAAQNHLTVAESQGYLEKSKPGITSSLSEDADKEIYYFVVGVQENDADSGSYISPDAASDAILSLMLPFASVDETVRLGGSYVIRYQKDPGLVLDVFYAEKDGQRFGHTYESDEYDDLMTTYYGPGKKGDRQSSEWNKAVLGWYGGAEAASLPKGADLKQPTVKIHNEDVLWVEVTNPNVPSVDPDYVKTGLKLVVTGQTSNASKEILLVYSDGNDTQGLAPEVYPETSIFQITGSVSAMTLVLDDITRKNVGENRHFASLFSGSGLIPGEEIEVYALAYNNFAIADSKNARSKSDFSNSLFDYDNDGKVQTDQIRYFRHLENLDGSISGFNISTLVDKEIEKVSTYDSTKKVEATQIRNLTWTDFPECSDTGITSKTGTQITYTDGGPATTDMYFAPVNPDYKLLYNGQSQRIISVQIKHNGNAGLFGSINDSEIKNLDLRLFDVTSTSATGHAGALAGWAENATVYNVLAFNKLGETTGLVGASAAAPKRGGGFDRLPILFTSGVSQLFDDIIPAAPKAGGSGESVERGIHAASGNAGGLIGGLKNSTVEFGAAALLVTSSGGDAGGLIGSASGEVSIRGSYSGGHTYDGQYKKEDNDYLNIVAGGSSGGLIGSASGAELEVENCYSTCAAKGSVAGGFIGSAGQVTIKGIAYCTGAVVGVSNSSTTDAFIGSFAADTGLVFSDGGKCYYVSDIASSKIDTVIPVAAGSDNNILFVALADRAGANNYDKYLNNKGFYFPSIAQLYGEGDTRPVGLLATETHFGDWHVPIPTPLEYSLINEDILKLELDVSAYKSKNNDNLPEYILISVTGATSGRTHFIKLNLSGGKYVLDGTGATRENFGKLTNNDSLNDKGSFQLGANLTPTNDKFTLVLDDITSPTGHFSQLFGEQGTPNPGEELALLPGEDITVRAVASENIVDLFEEDDDCTDNSLFAKTSDPLNSTGRTADIEYIRHLENLDGTISSYDPGNDNTVKATQINDLDWSDFRDAEKASSRITLSGGNDATAAGYYAPVSPAYKLDYDGGKHSITGVPVNHTDFAGLFGTLKSDDKVSDLELLNFTVRTTGSGKSAGSLAGTSQGTVTYVLARKGSGSSSTISASSGNAGGLIGSMTGGSVIKSAAAVTVSGSTAGGLIGSASGGSVRASYSGGQTSDGEYSRSSYNVTGSTYAGGLIGSAGGTNITYSYSTCSASGDTAGGLVGSISGGSVENTYATGLINGTTTAGAFAGSVSGTTLSGVNQYYDIINNEVTTAGSRMNSVGSGEFSGTGTLSDLDDTVSTFDGFVQVKASGANPAPAEPYDSYLTDIFGGKYDLKTVAQLGYALAANDFVATHYGDWPSPEIWVVNTPTGSTSS